MKPIYQVTETTENNYEHSGDLQLVTKRTLIFGIEVKRTQRLVEYDSHFGRFIDYGTPTLR